MSKNTKAPGASTPDSGRARIKLSGQELLQHLTSARKDIASSTEGPSRFGLGIPPCDPANLARPADKAAHTTGTDNRPKVRRRRCEGKLDTDIVEVRRRPEPKNVDDAAIAIGLTIHLSRVARQQGVLLPEPVINALIGAVVSGDVASKLVLDWARRIGVVADLAASDNGDSSQNCGAIVQSAKKSGGRND